MTKVKDFNLLLKALIGLCSIFFLSACASEAEKTERRENAYDISGDYKVNSLSGSEVEMNITIQNEKGRHDIVVSVERLSRMSEKEKNLLQEQGLNPELVAQKFGNKLILGKGIDANNLNGGENISSNFGGSSEFFVCTSEFQYNSEYKIQYCLSGEITKAERKLKGDLTLRWSRERKIQVNGSEQTELSSEAVYLSYKSDVSSNFYKQYLGSWSGEVYSLTAQFNPGVFKKVYIQENASLTFSAFLPSITSIEYAGEKFSFDSRGNVWNLNLLKSPDYPAIQMVFYSQFGRRIVLFGQIWSLGDFTGTITLILPDRQLDLATFKMKKD